MTLVFLTGFMGAGKSSVGRLLSARLDVPLVDLDDLIERDAGMAVTRVFAERGEKEFRRLEGRALQRAIEAEEGIVATGGGIVESESNLAAMAAAGPIVWLDVDFDTIVERLRGSEAESRPLFQELDEARKLYDRRRSAYGRCDLRVEIRSDEAVRRVAERIIEGLADRLREGS